MSSFVFVRVVMVSVQLTIMMIMLMNGVELSSLTWPRAHDNPTDFGILSRSCQVLRTSLRIN